MSQTPHEKSAIIANKLINDGIISPDKLDITIHSIIDANVFKNIKKRGKTAYNAYVEENKVQIKSAMGSESGRGAFIKKAGELWKQCTDEEKSKYQQIAENYNKTNKTIVVNKTIKVDNSNDINTDILEKFEGPFDNTKAYGKVPGTRSFKTFEKAYQKMKTKNDAAVIMQISNGKYKLFSGVSSKNDDENNIDNIQFIYKTTDDTKTWVRKEAITHYQSYGPFTEDNPFELNKAIKVSQKKKSIEKTFVKKRQDIDDSESDTNEPDEININLKHINNVKYWVFSNGRYVIKYVSGEPPKIENYIGKCYINNKLIDSCNTLPSKYIDYLKPTTNN